MKKSLLLASFVILGAAAAFADSEGEGARCSAETINAEGEYNPFVRVDCDSEYAGKCVKAAPADAETYWEIVDPAVCAKAAAEQGW